MYPSETAMQKRGDTSSYLIIFLQSAMTKSSRSLRQCCQNHQYWIWCTYGCSRRKRTFWCQLFVIEVCTITKTVKIRIPPGIVERPVMSNWYVNHFSSVLASSAHGVHHRDFSWVIPNRNLFGIEAPCLTLLGEPDLCWRKPKWTGGVFFPSWLEGLGKS